MNVVEMPVTTPGLDFVICPFDGNVFTKGQLNSVPESHVMAAFSTLAGSLLGNDDLARPDDRVLTDLESPESGEGALSHKDLYGEIMAQRAVEARMGPASGRHQWYVLPCGGDDHHFVPHGYIDAIEHQRASVIALVGPPTSGKTHVLSAVAHRLYSNQDLSAPPLLVESSVQEIRGHWDVFKTLYVDPLFRERTTLRLTQRDAEQYTSFLMVCEDGGQPGHLEWLVMTDCRGEATTPQKISERGRYLASADTVVLCIDGQVVVDLLGRRMQPFDEAQVEDLLLPAVESDGGLIPDLPADPERHHPDPPQPWTEPLDYCVSVSQFLDSADVRAHRDTIRKAARPNVVVAVTKADALEEAFTFHSSPLHGQIHEILWAEPARELDLSFVWRRHRLVATILMAAGLGALVQSVSRRFPHPIFTMVSATGCAAVSQNGVSTFPTVLPRGVDSLVINHLLSRRWFRTDTEGRFGPDD